MVNIYVVVDHYMVYYSLELCTNSIPPRLYNYAHRPPIDRRFDARKRTRSSSSKIPARLYFSAFFRDGTRHQHPGGTSPPPNFITLMA